jgi:hypothetical protein
LGLGGLLAGSYLWGHLGPPAKDPDDTDAYFCGLLVGGVMAIGGFGTLLWKFWPRATTEASQRVSQKLEAWKLTTDELLKRMSKEQAIIFIQGILRQMEESLNDPEVPAAKIRLEKVLDELKRC